MTMIRNILISLRAIIFFTILLGIFYPLTITGISQVVMPKKACGSLIYRGDKIIGSHFIGQEFTKPEYFHGRFSANNYDAVNSGGSNLAPSSSKLIDTVKQRIALVRKENNLTEEESIPADMVLASGSGLDPHISLANAMLQLPRVAKARGLSDGEVKKLINAHITPDFVGLWGEAGVNVLELNLALDELKR
jgi:potassium-transporting ATPase KdpC subunit